RRPPAPRTIEAMATTGRGSGHPGAPPPMLTVAAVARRLGVAPSTLRTWDRRYDLGPSGHTAGSHRRYSPEDLDRLVVMRPRTPPASPWLARPTSRPPPTAPIESPLTTTRLRTGSTTATRARCAERPP